MTGITNRPQEQEEQNQQRVQRRKRELRRTVAVTEFLALGSGARASERAYARLVREDR